MTSFREFGLFLIMAALATTPSGPTMAQPERLRFDTPTVVNGVEAVCTGIGSTARADPRWGEYPLKVEAVGRGGQYLGAVTMVVAQDGEEVVTVSCGGPWILFRLAPGSYVVSAMTDALSSSGRVNVPAQGQGRLILRFSEAGGALSPEHVPSPD